MLKKSFLLFIWALEKVISINFLIACEKYWTSHKFWYVTRMWTVEKDETYDQVSFSTFFIETRFPKFQIPFAWPQDGSLMLN